MPSLLRHDPGPIERRYTVREIAEITRAPESSVRHWLATDQIPSTRVGRRRLVRESDLRRWLGEREAG